MDKRGFTTAQAANYVGVSVSQLHALKAANRIVARRQSDNPRQMLTWLREDLDAYLDSLREV